MRFLRSFIPSLLVLGSGIATAASSWNFDEAVISVTGKGGAASGFKDKYVVPLRLCGRIHSDLN
jgi:oligosaccharyltransferase complex subunit delta (ribophorin II)